MGRRFAEFDWAAHPLGRPQDWSAEMRTIVATALTSRFPYLLWLGPDDLFMLYNDAYIPILGNRHPAALGQRSEQVWWDIWDSIGPLIASVIATGKAVWVDDLLLPVITGGRRGQRYFTFSYSPLMGDTGVVYGVMATVSETTERVLSTRRLHLLNAVAAAVMDTTIAITVADSGRWSGDSSASLRSYRRGRGLTLMSGLADRVDTVRDRWGTRMTMVFDHAVPG
jgi:hypothetical protein